ncbi:MAG: heavy metal translocating P-type ATPase [Roseburia sp.]|nr:heavy metal translocating P-type ATPase [Roseburia sp.]
MFAAALPCYILLEERASIWVWAAVFAVIYIVIGYDVLIRAAQNIAHGKVFDENFLMIVATVGAFAVTEFSEAVAVMLFYQVGEYFQSYAVNRSRKSISALMEICPETACVLTDGGEQIVEPDSVEVGSIIVVRTGERVPIDGTVESGEGFLDCSALTGESAPVAVHVGDDVLSGAISTSSVLRIRTQKPYADSAVAKILDLVENASAKKAKTENFITRFAAVYTPAVVIAAVLLAVVPPLFIGYNVASVWTEWLKRAFAFLVVSCPCALVISVPMSFFGGIGAASKRGILVKGGNCLEILNKADTIVFDKTGTVTKGSFEPVRILCADGVDENTVLCTAAKAESCSLHPIARSVVTAAEAVGFRPTANLAASEIAGRGIAVSDGDAEILCGSAALMTERGVSFAPVEGAVGTCVYVAENGAYVGAIEIADAVKDDSAAAVKAFKASGMRTVMLTGDNAATARAVAEKAGIDEFYAELLPEDKVRKMEEIKVNKDGEGDKDRRVAAFVGDGINDAPVISSADLGIAMGAIGSDAAIEAADIVLMNDRLSQIAVARKIAKKTVAVVKQNIVFALAVKALVLVLAAFGIASMWLAVFADVGVAVLAILNAMRVLKTKPEAATERTVEAGNRL